MTKNEFDTILEEATISSGREREILAEMEEAGQLYRVRMAPISFREPIGLQDIFFSSPDVEYDKHIPSEPRYWLKDIGESASANFENIVWAVAFLVAFASFFWGPSAYEFPLTTTAVCLFSLVMALVKSREK